MQQRERNAAVMRKPMDGPTLAFLHRQQEERDRERREQEDKEGKQPRTSSRQQVRSPRGRRQPTPAPSTQSTRVRRREIRPGTHASGLVAVVLGTYNRLKFLQDAIYSVRRAVSGVTYEIVVVDGGSTDGSRKWLTEQPDVTLIEQSGELTGAVKAFNLAFAHAIDRGARYVMHINDDCTIEGYGAIRDAVGLLESDPKAAAVAFAFDLRGGWTHEQVNGYTYVNFGLIRATAGIEVAKRQGDPTGRAWWNPIYRTYGADSEFGCWLHHIGWKVIVSTELRVHDRTSETTDVLRELNRSADPNRPDSRLFWKRWPGQQHIVAGPVA